MSFQSSQERWKRGTLGCRGVSGAGGRRYGDTEASSVDVKYASSPHRSQDFITQGDANTPD